MQLHGSHHTVWIEVVLYSKILPNPDRMYLAESSKRIVSDGWILFQIDLRLDAFHCRSCGCSFVVSSLCSTKNPNGQAKICYTAMHGVGGAFVSELFRRFAMPAFFPLLNKWSLILNSRLLLFRIPKKVFLFSLFLLHHHHCCCSHSRLDLSSYLHVCLWLWVRERLTETCHGSSGSCRLFHHLSQ